MNWFSALLVISTVGSRSRFLSRNLREQSSFCHRSSVSQSTAARFLFRCFSKKAKPKHTTDPSLGVMKQENDAFFVVRKGDMVGIYTSLDECQAQVGSVCNPPVSVYKGHCLSMDTKKHLQSYGLQNAQYTIRAADLKVDLFGALEPCPFQEMSWGAPPHTRQLLVLLTMAHLRRLSCRLTPSPHCTC